MKAALIALLVCGFLGTAFAQPKIEKGYTQLPSGTIYKFHNSNKKGRMPKDGEMLFLNFIVKTEKPDTLLFASSQVELSTGAPYYEMLAKPKFTGDYAEILPLMHVGDSLTAKFNVDTFFKYMFNMTVADLMFKVEPKSYVKMDIKLNKVMSMDSFKVYYDTLMVQRDRKATTDEVRGINDFLTINNLTITPKLSGLYIMETKPGTGRLPLPGDSVKIKYTGAFLDGTVFDSNESIDNNSTIVVGVGMVIPGFDEALMNMHAGSEATVIIPYRLAYGAQGMQGVIPPYSTLVFNLKMLEISEHK